VTETPVARSPIEQAGPVDLVRDWEVSRRKTSAPVRLADLTPMTKIGVKASQPALEVGYGRSVRVGDWLVTGSGPGEWTLLGPVGETMSVPTSGFATVIDLTHGRALMRLTGLKAARVMEKICSIDLSTPMCPNGAVFRAAVANVVTDVVRDDIGGVPSYLLHCERSSGQFLFDALLDAGTEFGIDIEGFPAAPAGGQKPSTAS
jgi:heterotetrameric sarcosine oxidase gamma subunit